MIKKTVLLFISIILFVYISNSQDGLKVYISVDMEGVAGVVARDQVLADGKDYNMARMWTTQETNAAIEGALEAGATEILINDSHGNMRNILVHELNPAARIISGNPKPLGMMQGIDESFDAVIFIGYHTRAGSANGVLDHSYSSASVYSLRVNDIEMGETELNTAVAGYFGVPVVLITGDKELCEQIKSFINPNTVCLELKEGIGRYAANTLVPSVAQKKIKENTTIALNKLNQIEAVKIKNPVKFEIDFLYAQQADVAELIPGVERIAPRTVRFYQNDLIEGYRLFRALLSLAR